MLQLIAVIGLLGASADDVVPAQPPTPWRLGSLQNPMTDLRGSVARVGSNERGLVIACSVDEQNRPLTVQIPAGRYFGGRSISVLLRFDAGQPRRYVFDVSSSGDRAVTFRQVDVEQILSGLASSNRVAIRLVTTIDEPLDLSFSTSGAAAAIEHVRRGCGATEPGR